jgi:DNA-directed RNA polymerase specialized sigma24 family protein
MPEDAADPALLPLAQLVAQCTAERMKFRRGEPSDPTYCLEVFRRALRRVSDDDWAALHTCFFQDVLRWVRYHPVMKSGALTEDAENYAHEAMERLLIANDHHPLDVSSLGAVLTFLRRCVSSVLLDALRAKRKEVPLDEVFEVAGDDPFAPFLEDEAAADLWRMVEQCVAAPRELRLARALWIEGYRPREIAQALPNDFANIQDVRRCIANIIDRLRRRYQSQSA